MTAAPHAPPQPPLLTAATLDEAMRRLLAVLPVGYTGVVLVDAGGADRPGAASVYSALGHQVAGIRDLALHFWAEARLSPSTDCFDVFCMQDQAKAFILANYDDHTPAAAGTSRRHVHLRGAELRHPRAIHVQST